MRKVNEASHPREQKGSGYLVAKLDNLLRKTIKHTTIPGNQLFKATDKPVNRRKEREMEEKVKVIEINAIAANGNNRNVVAVVSLETTLSDFCKEQNIPLLSIISVSTTEPMTIDDAISFAFIRNALFISNPQATYVKNNITFFAA